MIITRRHELYSYVYNRADYIQRIGSELDKELAFGATLRLGVTDLARASCAKAGFINNVYACYDFYVVGGRLVSLLSETEWPRNSDLDILMTVKPTMLGCKLVDEVNCVFSNHTPAINAYSSRFLAYNTRDVGHHGRKVQFLVMKNGEQVDNVIDSYDMCQCRVAYNIATKHVVAKIPNMYCTLTKTIATTWTYDSDVINFGIEPYAAAKLHKRIIKYKDRGFVVA